ncbi:galactosylceramide sulfotransferase-like, partial [Limulus polyphemus]|uniref:Galactosylceramide sulfotransferase-like n=1 Tax=Limulus polyphemus TaxID=6850 RepID=A0ABM1BZR0_LIMPO
YLNTFRTENIVFTTGSPNFVQKKTNIVFLKTHKTAGSSIQNMLMRFADRHDLLLALPAEGNFFGHPPPFHHSMISDPPDKRHYNIFTHHTRFNYDELRRVMPEDSIFITVLRDPVDLFESLYSYCKLEVLYRRPLFSFGINMSDEEIEVRMKSLAEVGINQMSFDLGMNPKDFKNPVKVQRYAHILDTQFDLVLITEHLDESLVILKNILSWETDDVVFFKLNARHETFVKHLPSDVRKRLQSINFSDQVIYDFFKEKLAEKIRKFGEKRLALEVQELRRRREEWAKFCVKETQLLIESEDAKKTSYLNSQVTKLKPRQDNDTCRKMTALELDYTEELRQKQNLLYLKHRVG